MGLCRNIWKNIQKVRENQQMKTNKKSEVVKNLTKSIEKFQKITKNLTKSYLQMTNILVLYKYTKQKVRK